jgi:uncharacterized membrane protein YczE
VVPEATRISLWDALLCPRCRAKRVIALLVGIVLMSLGDLYMTLQHLTHIGMLEDNPLALAIMQYGSSWGLAAWKLCTIALAAGILLYARRRASAEAGALFCCIVMTWLTSRWVDYSDHLTSITRDAPELVRGDDDRWVSLPPDS